MSKFLVGIDAGHGMNTAGKRTPELKENLYIDGKLVRKRGNCIHEFEWNIEVSKYLAKALTRCNIDYVYLMDEDGSTDTPLSTRSKKANSKKCDIVVSNHYNAYGGCSDFVDKKGGLLVLRTNNSSSKSIKLGELVAKQLEEDISYGYSYGLRKDVDISGFTLAILRQTNMPAILIEYGFMDVLKEAKLMLDTKYQKKCAESVCKAICKYFGVTYKAEDIETKPGTSNNKTTWKNGTYNCKVKATANLNLRTGRGTNYSIIHTIPKGTVFTVGYVNNNWGSTWDFKGQVGYLSCDYIEKV